MPSPIAHAAVGATLYWAWRSPEPASPRVVGRIPLGLVAFVGLSLAPDLDAAVGILLGDLGRYHNNFAGTPVFGALAALLAGGIAGVLRRSASVPVFSLTYVCYQVHVLMDFFTIGRGAMLLWPVSDERFQPPFHLFYGVRWSDGLFSPRHFLTVFSELAFVTLLLVAFRLVPGRRDGERER